MMGGRRGAETRREEGKRERRGQEVPFQRAVASRSKDVEIGKDASTSYAGSPANFLAGLPLAN